MAKKRDEKQRIVDDLRQELLHVSTLVLTSFSGLTVEKDTELRRAVEAAGGKYQVVKNTLAELAAKGTQASQLLQQMKGNNAIAYTTGDPVALAKSLTKFAKDNETFRFRAGVVEGRTVSVEELEALAALPTHQELLAKLLGLLMSPAQRLAGLLNQPARLTAATIKQAVEEKKFSEG